MSLCSTSHHYIVIIIEISYTLLNILILRALASLAEGEKLLFPAEIKVLGNVEN